MAAPRSRSSSLSRRPRISWPRSLTLPVAVPLRASNPMIDIRIWLLPEPDSPTIPTVSPGLSDRLTSLTAATLPLSVWNRMRRSLISRIGATESGVIARGAAGARISAISAVLWIEGIAQAVGDEIQAEKRERQGAGGKDQLIGLGIHGGGTGIDQRAPARRRFLNTQAQIGKEGFADDQLGHQQTGIGDD